MPKLNKKTLLGIKTETAQNGGASLANTDFLWVADATIDTKAEKLARDYSRNYLEPVPHLIGKKSVEVKFKTELKGSGASTTLVDAPLMAALEACGLSAVLSEASASSFRTSSTNATGFFGPGRSAYIDLYKDGIKHGVSGALGSLKIDMEAGKIPMIEFTFSGLYADPTDTTNPTATPNTTSAPVVQLAGFGVHNYVSPNISKLDIDLGTKVTERPSIIADSGLTGFMVTSFEPKGSFDPEVPTVAIKAFVDEFTSGTTGTLSAQIGTVAGNRITVSAACVAFDDTTYANRNDILTYNIPFSMYSNVGGDALTIKFS